jgi:transposase
MRYELSDSEWSVIDAMLPNKPRGVLVSTIGAFSMASSGYCDRAHPGGTCRLSMVLAPLATIVSSAGVEQAFGKAS